jgi:peptidoglycan biosynthesis protein MviN/MurJ (putative lipid II flippase)
VLFAAAFGLAASVAAALPLTAWLGPIGAAIAAVVAFVPAAGVYCWRIAKAAGLPMRRTFPLGTFARLVVWAAIPGALAAGLDDAFDLSPIRSLLVTIAVVGVGFAALATRAGDLDRDHWRYLGRWLSLRPLRDRIVDRR